jgi:hypothetical protein
MISTAMALITLLGISRIRLNTNGLQSSPS